MAPSSSLNIEVLSPRSGDSIKSGFIVKGNARTFESNVVIRLSDSEGVVLTETFSLANAPDAGQFGPFEKVLDFQTDDSVGTLEVFQYSAKNMKLSICHRFFTLGKNKTHFAGFTVGLFNICFDDGAQFEVFFTGQFTYMD